MAWSNHGYEGFRWSNRADLFPTSNFWLFFHFFRELHVRKFRKFSPDHFYDIKNRFYDKKTDFRPKTGISSETTRESRVRRPGNLEWDDPGIMGGRWDHGGTKGPRDHGRWMLVVRLRINCGASQNQLWCVSEIIVVRLWNAEEWNPGFLRCLTRDSWVVSLEIPGFPATISGFLDFFFRKKFGTSKKSFFLDSRDQNKILKFLWFFYMTSISYMNPSFLAPSLLKPLKSSSRYQNLPGFLLTAHSDHRGPVSAQFCPLSCHFLTFGSFINLS